MEAGGRRHAPYRPSQKKRVRVLLHTDSPQGAEVNAPWPRRGQLRMVTHLAMVGEIETGTLVLFVRTEPTTDGLDHVEQNHGGEHAVDHREANGLQLLEPQAPAHDVFEVEIEVGVDLGCRKKAGEQSTQSATHAVHTEGVERVVVTQ